MELLTIRDASRQAEVSDKTLRRAIKDGKLQVQPRLYGNQPLLIDTNELTRYLASRHVSTTDVQTPGDTQTQERIAAMESRIQKLETLVQSLQEQVQTLTGKFTTIQVHTDVSPLLVQSNGSTQLDTVMSSHVQTDKPKQRIMRTKQDAPVFDIAYFSQQWQDEYKSTAIHQDVKAHVILRPTIDEPGRYHIASCNWEPTKVKRVIHEDMRQRGEALRDALLSAVHKALVAHSWKVIDMHHSYRLPDA